MIIKILSVFDQTLNHSEFAETHLIEANDFQFRNHKYNSMAEFEVLEKELEKKMWADFMSGSKSVESMPNHALNELPNELKKKLEGWMMNNAEYPMFSSLILPTKAYVLLGCSVYVMNDQGKTIDCLNNQILFTPEKGDSVLYNEGSQSQTAVTTLSASILSIQQEVKEELSMDDIFDGLFPVLDKMVVNEEEQKNRLVFLQHDVVFDEGSEEESYDDLYGGKDVKEFLEEITNQSVSTETTFSNSVTCTPIVPVDTTGKDEGFRG